MSLSLIFLFGSIITVVDARGFLARLPEESAEADRALLAELEGALGKEHRQATEKRLERLAEMLRPIFAAMDKNKHGKLGSAAASYILHRVFVQRHGWFIRALEPAGGSFAAWNTSNPTAILKERVPDHVQNLFEKRLAERGLGLKELAVLAATLEHLVHTEALQRLNASYAAKEYSPENMLSEEKAMGVIDVYMALYLGGFLHSHQPQTTWTAELARELHAAMPEEYPTFNETQIFYKEVYQSVVSKRRDVSYNDVDSVIAEIGDRYGPYQNTECSQYKDWLLDVEDSSPGGAGRVRISDFYGKAINEGKWQFGESIDYLRQLGALDESDPFNLRVIIPNYMSGPSNCVASSNYYSVCCMDECEGILGRLEELVAAPEASASTIANHISMISSATVPGNRTLSPWLLQRLDEVSKHHGGVIPLHGRLFMQWLHYAYPRECSFPHVSGTIDPQRPEDIVTEDVANGQTNLEKSLEWLSPDEAEMKKIIAQAVPGKKRIPGSEATASEESAMWTMEEELVVWRDPAQRSIFSRLFAI